MKSSSRLHSAFILIFVLSLLVAFVYYLYTNANEYLTLLHFSLLPIVLILSLTIGGFLINGAINTYLFRGLGVELSFRDGFLLAASSTLANQLPISGGIIARGFYLKREHNFPYAKFFSATLALFFCFVAANGIIGLAILAYWMFFTGKAIHPLLIAGFFLMTVSILTFWLPIGRVRMPVRILHLFDQALNGWYLIRKNYLLVAKLIGLQTGLMLMLAFRYWLAFHMLSQDVSVGDVILFSSAAVLTQLVSVAPGGLGVTEAIVGGVASALGFDLGVSVAAVALDRLISTMVILLVGGISTVILGKQMTEGSLKPKERDA